MLLRGRNRVIVLFLGISFGCFAPRAASQSKAEGQGERIRRIETSAVNIRLSPDEPPLQMDLEKLMATFKVPGLSIAVIDNYQIAWTKTYGVTDAGSNKPVTTTTLFQAGSISKPVAATGALVLVEQGKLSLDQDVNLKLKSWKVPENEFTKTEKVTLRRLMSHTAGLTVHGFPGYDVSVPLPTLVQIFNGEKPANTEPIRVDIVPGTQERYSGGGVTIEQQLMIDVTGKPFPEYMREAVFEKIGMTNSSYEQPLPQSWACPHRLRRRQRWQAGFPRSRAGPSTCGSRREELRWQGLQSKDSGVHHAASFALRHLREVERDRRMAGRSRSQQGARRPFRLLDTATQIRTRHHCGCHEWRLLG